MTERPTRRRSVTNELLVRHYLDLIESGQEPVIRRIQETLGLDSETKPTVEQIRVYVKGLMEGTNARRKP
jgi:hypothetical protein